MPSDYRAIRQDNERRYGTDIGRIGPMLLADRYDDRTHFIYELLQNAEDALTKRVQWRGKRSVRFEVGHNELRVSHFGKLFDEADVRGICGIAQSTKDLTAIGRFGIGFKSVYAFTNRPEVYSGDERFAIDSFVWPVASAGRQHDPDETVVVLPFTEPSGRAEIEAGLKRLGPASLLFLRAIEEIEWSIDGGPSGVYLRSKPEWLTQSVRRVAVIGQSAGAPEIQESWLLFSKPVSTPQGNEAGYVEVAFLLSRDTEPGRERVCAVPSSPLVVFFPTVRETHLGFLVQGPYRTTPSRDNVPVQDDWNQHCVAETVTVLRDALVWLRDNDYLDEDALCCLPLDRAKFPEAAMFAPMFGAVRDALAEEALLPRHGGGHASGRLARFASSKELRELLSPAQLTALLGAPQELAWLSEDISQDRTPELREYLTNELRVEEVRPVTLLPKLSQAFLEAQPDEWVRRLYEFLGDQRALRLRAREFPLVRLDNGSHVCAQANGQALAYLPGTVATGFPTVRSEVCDTEESRGFLKALGLMEPDLVEDVIVNVLPRYPTDGGVVCDAVTYAADIDRMLHAYRTDSDSRRSRLVSALQNVRFVACLEQRDKSSQMATPEDVYLATERLTQLFDGVEGVLIVDEGHAFLRSDDVRTLLVACGCYRYLDPIPTESDFDEEKRTAIRRKAGLERASSEKPIVDWTLRGLGALLKRIEELHPEERHARAALLWDTLADLERRKGSGAFFGSYSWSYSHEAKTARFRAAFVRLLNETTWIADSNGTLHRPCEILFEELGWTPNPFLLSLIHFKPPELDQLARVAGVEPGMLDLLRKLGIKSEAELRARLRVEPDSSYSDKEVEGGVDETSGSFGPTGKPTSHGSDHAATDLQSSDSARADGARQDSGGGAATAPVSSAGFPSASGIGQQQGEHGGGAQSGNGSRSKGEGAHVGDMRTAGPARGRPFISYVGTDPDDEGLDPDGLDREARMVLEEKAIALILEREPQWQRTPPDNPGFDLFQSHSNGQLRAWCEVKAMTGSLDNRPVGLSHTQFSFAREHGVNYWLYIVERTGRPDASLVRIQDPAGRARTFTFDCGWRAIAEVDAL